MNRYAVSQRAPVDTDDHICITAFLCSPFNRFIVGKNIVIDGGQHAS
jgi:3-oxoacyl-[acyl-carrier protein] reductase